jgi:magnesium transporter
MSEILEQEELKNIYAHLQQLLDEQEYERLEQELIEMEPVEVADFLKKQDEGDAFLMLNRLASEIQSEVFANFEHSLQRKLAEYFSPRELAKLLTNMSSDDRADLFQNLAVDRQDKVLPYLNKPERDDIISLSSYPKQTAGAAMSSDFATISLNMTVEAAMAQIRRDSPSKETIYYVYVVDEERHLIGIVSLRKLIMAQPKETIANIVKKDVIYVNVADDQETAIEQVEKYDLIALPVVNNDNQLVGIITHDDAFDIMRQEQTEDVQKMAGMESLDEPYTSISYLNMIKKRAGWLIVLFIGETLTATAMSFYEGQIAKAVVLALFVPLIISSGGNSGSQASTLIIRAMALGEITIKDWWRIVGKEFSIGLALGIILGIIGFLRVTAWSLFSTIYGPHWLLIAFTVGFSLVGVVMWGTLSGSLLPIFLKRMGFDPAVSSAPFVATLVDVTGLIIYFSVATLFLRGILL